MEKAVAYDADVNRLSTVKGNPHPLLSE